MTVLLQKADITCRSVALGLASPIRSDELLELLECLTHGLRLDLARILYEIFVSFECFSWETVGPHVHARDSGELPGIMECREMIFDLVE
jgi:hypothetical protein